MKTHGKVDVQLFTFLNSAQMEVSGQLHVLVTLLLWKSLSKHPLDRRLGGH
jgi:hypothetical protein